MRASLTIQRIPHFHTADGGGSPPIFKGALGLAFATIAAGPRLSERVANAITARLHASQAELEQARGRSSARLLERQRALQAKIDRVNGF